MATVKCYVDGLNLFHAIKDLRKPELAWLNLMSVARAFMRPDDQLLGVHHFTAVIHWDKEKQQGHRAYLAALRAYGVCVTESHFKKNSKICSKYARSCPFYEEKQTDVALATQVLRDALTSSVERQLVITADADHVPLFQHVRDACPDTRLELIAPPGRLHRARELGKFAAWHGELTVGQLLSCMLPSVVLDTEGLVIARAPAGSRGEP